MFRPIKMYFYLCKKKCIFICLIKSEDGKRTEAKFANPYTYCRKCKTKLRKGLHCTYSFLSSRLVAD